MPCTRRALWVALAITLSPLSLLAQGGTSSAADASRGKNARPVKADSVTINMPEGMSKDQADAILNELRQIRQLLERQNAPAPAQQAAAPAPSDKVSMPLDASWPAMGRADAPVTVVEFTDYQCPFCRRFEADSFESYPDQSRRQIINRHRAQPAKAAGRAPCDDEETSRVVRSRLWIASFGRFVIQRGNC